MYIACRCPNLVSVHFSSIPILHFKFPKFLLVYIEFLIITFIQNHMAERIWWKSTAVKKLCLRDMQEAGMDDPLHKYCTSWITVRVASIGASSVVKSWNEHRIPSEFHG